MKKDQRIDLIARQATSEIIAEQSAGPESAARRVANASRVVRLYRRLRNGGMQKQKKPRKYRRIARRLCSL